MMRSLWTAASGMTGQQFNIDTISNNLANVNTTGFKQMRPDFEDLLYQTERLAGTPATEATVVPTGVQVGHGVRPAATQKIFTQGALQSTGNTSDIAIEGEGFFRVVQYDGTYGYTRDGSFKIDSNGQLVTSDGYKLSPEVILPEGFVNDSLTISQDGRITVKVAGSDDPIEVGQLEIYRFVNPAGLESIGENLMKVTNASGDAIPGKTRIRRHGKDAAEVPGNVERLRGQGDGQHDRGPARLRAELPRHPDVGLHAPDGDLPQAVRVPSMTRAPRRLAPLFLAFLFLACAAEARETTVYVQRVVIAEAGDVSLGDLVRTQGDIGPQGQETLAQSVAVLADAPFYIPASLYLDRLEAAFGNDAIVVGSRSLVIPRGTVPDGESFLLDRLADYLSSQGLLGDQKVELRFTQNLVTGTPPQQGSPVFTARKSTGGSVEVSFSLSGDPGQFRDRPCRDSRRRRGPRRHRRTLKTGAPVQVVFHKGLITIEMPGKDHRARWRGREGERLRAGQPADIQRHGHRRKGGER